MRRGVRGACSPAVTPRPCEKDYLLQNQLSAVSRHTEPVRNKQLFSKQTLSCQSSQQAHAENSTLYKTEICHNQSGSAPYEWSSGWLRLRIDSSQCGGGVRRELSASVCGRLESIDVKRRLNAQEQGEASPAREGDLLEPRHHFVGEQPH